MSDKTHKTVELPIRKVVSMPITVPTGDYCWDGRDQICHRFSNEGGYATCGLSLGNLEADENGRYPKPDKCKNLK